jgi:SNF2 family DNA or RNA helicase
LYCKVYVVTRHYQEYAAQRIVESSSVGLFIDMGMGKTIIALTALMKLLANRRIGKALVIAPLRVAETTWSDEAAKWEHTRHMRISKVLGSKSARFQALDAPADIYVINRENVPWLVEYLGKRWPFDMVIIDELSSFKSGQSVRFKALKSVRPRISRMVGLTGTPTPNGLLDLWSQVYLLDGGERLGKFITHYRQKYFDPEKYNPQTGIVYSWALKPGAGERIHAAIADLCVSMGAEDYLTLPPRIDHTVSITLPPTAQRQYKQLEKDLLLPLVQSDIVAGSAAILAGKLLQFANGAVYDEYGDAQEIHTAKLDALTDIAEAANGSPLLVFYTFRHDARRIASHLAAAGYPVTILRDKQDILDWNAGKIPLLLVHPASAGHGLNLQAGGHTVVWFGLPWSLELYEQGNARIHRQGQERPVVVYHLAATGTIDEDVMTALEGKTVGQAALLAAVRARLTAKP